MTYRKLSEKIFLAGAYPLVPLGIIVIYLVVTEVHNPEYTWPSWLVISWDLCLCLMIISMVVSVIGIISKWLSKFTGGKND